MNSLSAVHRITSYEELQRERSRLEAQIKYQKHVISQDLEALKQELRQEARPALEAANFVKKITTRETRTETVMQLGSSMLVDLLLRRLFMRSNVLVRLIVPPLLKNYTSHLFFNFAKNNRQRQLKSSLKV